MEAQVTKRPTDDQILSAIKQGFNTSAKLMKHFYNTDSARSTDPNYKHLNKRLVSLRKYKLLKVSEIQGLTYVLEVMNR